MNILQKGILFSGSHKGKDNFSCFPGLCIQKNGEILASFQCGAEKMHPHGTVFFSRSVDGGNTWSDPEQPFREWASSKGLTVHVAYISESIPGRLLVSLMICNHGRNSDLPFMNSITGGIIPISIGLSESLDGGRSWTNPRILNAGRFNEVPVPIMSPIIRTLNGDLLLPFETSKNYNDTGVWEHFAASLVSGDDGETWDEVIVVAHDPENRYMYWDHRMVAIDGGRCLDFFYTFDNIAGKETKAHRSVSLDGGRTWPEKPVDTGLVGQPWPVPIQGDEIVVLTVDRYGQKAIIATLSSDLGNSWSDELVIYRHTGINDHSNNLLDNLNEQKLWLYGLSSGIATGAREILTVWYAGFPKMTSIEFARISV